MTKHRAARNICMVFSDMQAELRISNGRTVFQFILERQRDLPTSWPLLIVHTNLLNSYLTSVEVPFSDSIN